MDTVDSENYRRRMQHWNMTHSKTNRLSAGADNAGLEPSLAWELRTCRELHLIPLLMHNLPWEKYTWNWRKGFCWCAALKCTSQPEQKFWFSKRLWLQRTLNITGCVLYEWEVCICDFMNKVCESNPSMWFIQRLFKNHTQCLSLYNLSWTNALVSCLGRDWSSHTVHV